MILRFSSATAVADRMAAGGEAVAERADLGAVVGDRLIDRVGQIRIADSGR